MILVLVFSILAFSDECALWFKKNKVKTDYNCITNCAILATGMDTIHCPLQCEKLCSSVKKLSLADKILGELLYYPGLTLEEQELIKQYPRESLKVFQAKEKAESLTNKYFNRSDQNDESDAFRHFMWAGLLSKELGSDLAKKFLDAHEAGPNNGEEERAMDLANNREGLLTADRLRKNSQLSEDNLIKEAKLSLDQKRLIVLRKKGGPK